MNKLTPSVYFASQNMASVFLFMSIGIMIFASKLMAGDAADKTINYEFMAGHSRNEIFVGRIIAGFLWGALLVFILMLLPIGLSDVIYGWGLETNKSEVLIRCALCIFPIIRLCAYNMMLASLTRSAGKGIALGYATLMIVAIATSSLEEFFNIVIKYSTGFTNVSYLLISENSKYEVINGETISVFDTSVTGEMIWKTIAMSAIFTVIYLTVTYINFKKTDRD
ncbi:MAG: ABC transporter permease subunit [Eubacterium sp.]|nr:ABC transporter permease subunit [Eubacterium sp.]